MAIMARPIFPNKTIGGYDYKFADPVPDDYTCPNCRLVQRDAHQVTCCGKIYCKSCLEQLRKKANKFECPNCRSSLAGDYKFFPDKNTVTKINHLRIHCTNKERSCKWVGHLKDLDTVHRPECPNEIVECTNKKQSGKPCDAKIQRCDLTVHKTQLCQWRIVKCPHCHKEGHHAKITGRHLRECPDLELPCGNNGCPVKTKRRLTTEHYDECSKQIVACQYRIVGCEEKFTRESTQDHNKEFIQHHLDKAVNNTETRLNETIQQLNKTTRQLNETTERSNETEKQLKTTTEQSNETTERLNATQTQLNETTRQLTRLSTQLAIKNNETEMQLTKTASSIEDLQSNSRVTKIPIIRGNDSIGSGFYLAKSKYNIFAKPGRHHLVLKVITERNRRYQLYMTIMSGLYDDELEWPVSGTVTVQLLNQREDRRHRPVANNREVKFREKIVAPAVYGEWIHLGNFTIEQAEHIDYMKDNNQFFKVTGTLKCYFKDWLQ